MRTYQASGARLAPAGVALLAGFFGTAGAAAMEANAEGDLPGLMRLSIEELANMEISSVSRRAEPVSAAPAAVYVITPDEIRHSGARTLPEVLRLAPNLLVGRVDSNAYAISARGFNTVEASNKLLALMDGRSMYSPLHSGVYWDLQDTLLDDIARIEVISGPGGTLWGANAVNGVINIITKSSRDTQGTFVKLGAGNIDQSGGLRYGGALNEALTYRIYAKGSRSGNSFTPAGVGADDSFVREQGGFRADWVRGADTVVVQGDIYNADAEDSDIVIKGGNAVFTWTRTLETSQFKAKVYYDRNSRSQTGTSDFVESYDAELQHNFTLGSDNDFVWGAGYRHNREEFINTLNIFSIQPPERTLEHVNVYVQDTYHISPALRLIAGIKFERNQFTGWEIMPSARIAWQVAPETLLWAAVSRSVRTPNRIDRELVGLPIVIAASGFTSEELLAYEAGYRMQATSRLTLSISGYYNIYNDLRTTGTSPGGTLPYFLQNGRSGQTYGVEAWSTYQVNDNWRLDAGLNWMGMETRVATGQFDLIPHQHLGNNPDAQAFVRSTVYLTPEVDLMLGLRVVDDLPFPDVPGYTELDARIAWRAQANLEFSISGTNLLHDSHPEAGDPATRREVRRSAFATVRWSY